MGATNSKGEIPLRQTEADLHWILSENVKWSEKSDAAKLLLDGTIEHHGTNLNQANAKIFREVDGILAEGAGSTAIQSKPSLSQQILGPGTSASSANTTTSTSSSGYDSNAGSRYGSGSNTDIFDMDKPIALPLSHPAHQFQASQFFGVAATKEILLMNNSSGKSTTLTDVARQGFDQLQERGFEGVNQHGSLRDLFASPSTSVSSSGGDYGGYERRMSNSSILSDAAYDRRTSIDLNTGSPDQQLSGPLVTNPHESLVAGHVSETLSNDRRAMTQEQGDAARDNYVPPSNYDTLPTRQDSAHGVTFPHGAGTFGLPSGVASSTNTILASSNANQQIQPSLNPVAASKERVELATKYLYIHGLIQKMISSAQLSYQVSLQLESLRKRLKPKRTRGLAQEQINEMRAAYESKMRVLRDSRELFLKSRLTLQWFYRDFDLNYGLHLLHDCEVLTRREREEAVPLQSIQQVEHRSFGSGLPTHQQQLTLAQYDQTLTAIESRRTALELRLMANERYALSIAHYYLSKHSAGNGLTMQDAPDLDPTLFHLLDVTHTQVVTREQLHMGLHRLSETLDSLNARILALRMHNESMADAGATGGQNSNVVSSNATKIARLQAEQQESRKTLQAIYTFFLHCFTRNVFVNLDQSDYSGRSIQAVNIDARGLRQDLTNLSTQQQAVNPLDIANEGVIGPDETVRPENVATGQPVEHQATEVTAPGVMDEGFGSSSTSSGLPQADERLQRETGLLVPPSDMTALLLSKTNKRLPATPNQSGKSAGVSPMPTVAQLAQKAQSSEGEINRNASLAPKLHASELQKQHEALSHVPATDVRESMFGGLHDAKMPEPEISPDRTGNVPLAEIVVATAWQAPVLQHQLTPIAEVVTPSPYGGHHDKSAEYTSPVKSNLDAVAESPRNAALAGIVKPRDLQRAELELERPSNVTVLPNGSVHDRDAVIALPPSPRDLKQQHKTLKHVSWKKAQLTPSGGLHALTKANVHVIPEQVYAPDIDGSTNGGLARIIQPGHLRAEKDHLSHLTGLKPSSFGGHHDPHANLETFIDPLELQIEKKELLHVPLEQAPHTLSGGVHTINRALDTHIVPERVLDSEAASNAPLAPLVTPSALVQEKRHLDHVPIETQRSTLSGGLHMNDESSHLHPSFIDKVKSFVGLETGLDTTAPELGKVVSSPSHARRPAYAQTAYMKGHSTHLRQERAAPIPAIPMHGALAGKVGDSDLIVQRRQLHHVPIERIELKRDLAAGVGSVTTRKATVRRRPIANAQFQGEQQLHQPHPRRQQHIANIRELPPHHGKPGDPNFDFEHQPSHSEDIPPRLPHVVGRTSSSSSRVSSPARVPLDRQLESLDTKTTSVHFAPNTMEFSKTIPQLEDPLLNKESQSFDPTLAREQNIAIGRPQRQTMQQ